MRSSKVTADVRAFFTSYCTAFIRQDAPAIAKHFADIVHVATDVGDDVNVHVANAAANLPRNSLVLGFLMAPFSSNQSPTFAR